MFSQIHYLIRSKTDGKYLAAHVGENEDAIPKSYLLLFHESFEAMSYVNAHAQDLATSFAYDSVSVNQLKYILQRWGFDGVGVVEDPLLPEIEFLLYDK